MRLTTVGFLAGSLVLCAATIRPAGAAEANCAADPQDCAGLAYVALTYPYERLPGSYLYVDGGTYPYVAIGKHLLDDSTLRLPGGEVMTARKLLTDLGLAAEIDRPLKPVVGYGSNPAPSQLARKFAPGSFEGHAVVPVMKGELRDFDVVWTPLFVGYGALPATIAPSPGTTVEVWVTWLDAAAEARMDDSEGTGHLYAVVDLPPGSYRFDGPDPETLAAYFACAGTLAPGGTALAVAGVPAIGRSFRAVDETGALAAVMPALGWTGSALELVMANLTDVGGRAARNEAIKGLGSFAGGLSKAAAAGCGS